MRDLRVAGCSGFTFFREVTVRSNRRIRWAAVPVAVGLVIALAGCTQQQLNGWLPGTEETKDVTNHTSRIVGLWTTSWVVLLAVGLIVWGLIIWAAIVYRRRKGQTGLPVQMRYNMPLEIFYTIVPLILVLGFFAFTAKDQAAIEKPFTNPDATVHVYGKRWAWDFNYIDQKNPDESVYYQGIQAQEEENAKGAIDESQLPTSTCRRARRSRSSSPRATSTTRSGSSTSSTRRTCSRARRTTSTSSRRSSAPTRASAPSSAVSTTRSCSSR